MDSKIEQVSTVRWLIVRHTESEKTVKNYQKSVRLLAIC